MFFHMYNQAFKQLRLKCNMFVLQYDYVKFLVRKIHVSFYVERIKNNQEEYFVSQTTPRC